jgi:hypothetical protein
MSIAKRIKTTLHFLNFKMFEKYSFAHYLTFIVDQICSTFLRSLKFIFAYFADVVFSEEIPVLNEGAVLLHALSAFANDEDATNAKTF